METSQAIRKVFQVVMDSIENGEGVDGPNVSKLTSLTNSYTKLLSEMVKIDRLEAEKLEKMSPEEKDSICLEHLLDRPASVIRWAIDNLEPKWLSLRKKKKPQ